MALTKFGFIVTGSGLDARVHRMVMRSESFEMVVVGVATAADGPSVARTLVDEGAQLIELCGGFGPTWTAQVISAIGARVPVGAVGYGPEAISALHALFE